MFLGMEIAFFIVRVQDFMTILAYLVQVGFFGPDFVPIRISSKFSQNCLKKFPNQKFRKQNCKIYFFLQLTELVFIHCYNYLNTLNTLQN